MIISITTLFDHGNQGMIVNPAKSGPGMHCTQRM